MTFFHERVLYFSLRSFPLDPRFLSLFRVGGYFFSPFNDPLVSLFFTTLGSRLFLQLPLRYHSCGSYIRQRPFVFHGPLYLAYQLFCQFSPDEWDFFLNFLRFFGFVKIIDVHPWRPIRGASNGVGDVKIITREGYPRCAAVIKIDSTRLENNFDGVEKLENWKIPTEFTWNAKT